MNLQAFVKDLRNIMRQDAGVNGDAQRIEQMTWLLFLKVYDTKEMEEWELEDDYVSIIPERFKWRNWAVDKADGKALTGEELIAFVTELFNTLKNLPTNDASPVRHCIVRAAFEKNNNYMKNGVLLRQVVNKIDEVPLEAYSDRHTFGEIYESILQELHNARSAGEFYTPRAITDFMAQTIRPRIGERIADFACGTGGFLTSALKVLDSQKKTVKDIESYNNAIFGIEKKGLPFLLCATNLLLHDVDNPNIVHGNTLEQNVRDYTEEDRFDVILMNPPYGGSESESVKQNFPAEFRSSETADLFVAVILYRLKQKGRCAVILPDGFLFGTDNAKVAIKQRLLKEFNLHTIIRLPDSVFAPYTSITTNILFFDRTGPTKKTWLYRMDMPDGMKHFSKTKPIMLEHMAPVMEWWNHREPLEENGFDKARCYTAAELLERNCNLDLCGFPHAEEEILPPAELFQKYHAERAALNAEIDGLLAQLSVALNLPMPEETP